MKVQQYKVLVIEDHDNIRRDLCRLVNGHRSFTVVGECGSVEEAKKLVESQMPDLLLLDITLLDGSAFDLIEAVSDKQFKIIFITAYQEYAIKAIKLGAVDYLLKPVDTDELYEALDKAIQSLPFKQEQMAVIKQHFKQGSNRILIPTQNHFKIIEFEEIVYCTGGSGYSTFHLADNKKIITTKNLKDLEELLPSEQFVRTHQSYLVNHRYIDSYYKEGYLLLKNKAKIPVSIRRRDVVISFLS